MNAAPARVLLADDDVFVSEVIARDLGLVGFEVIARVADGETAVEETHRLRPDVVVLDVQMPRLDGLSAAAAIQARCPTPVVLLTAFDGEVLVSRAAAAGVGAYLVKPSTPEELLRAVSIARARFEDLRELRRLNDELQAALAQVKLLSGLLPICSSCKQIRDPAGRWWPVETYVMNHSSAEFTHGICPGCERKLFAD